MFDYEKLELDPFLIYYNQDSTKWIEGIGSTAGLFLEIIVFSMSYNTVHFKLACMKQGDEWVYLDNNCNKCFCDYYAGDISNVKNNPFSITSNKSERTIFISGTILSPIYLELINLQGRIVKTETIHSSEQTISHADLYSGVYLYRIKQEGKMIQSGKLLLE